MRKILFLSLMLTATAGFSQEAKLYDPSADAKKDIEAAVNIARNENKFILLQGGGNWCSWCIEFARFAKADQQIDSVLKANFIWYHLNYSKENKNEEVFAEYGYPQRFGFPVFIVLDGTGKRIHTQNSEYLEDGNKSYDRKKVMAFLKNWAPAAVNPETYK